MKVQVVLVRVVAAAVLIIVAGPAAAWNQNEDGWTVLSPTIITKRVYVSSSTGNDFLIGATPSTAVRTLARAKDLMRDDFPDWMLLKRGDIWNEPIGDWQKSGLGAAVPMAIGTYGSGPRPIVRPGDTFAFRILNADVRHLGIFGIHFQGDQNPYAGRKSGVSILGPAQNILFEDCYIEDFGTNIVMQAFAGPVSDITLRRSIVADAFSLSSISNGMFISGVNGFLMEENVLDHNGWREGLAPKSIFNRNTYIQYDCTDVIYRRNISTRSSASAVSMRPGGIVEDNLLVANPIGIGFGSTSPDSVVGGVGGSITGNVILHSNDIEEIPHGWGIWVSNIGVDDALLVADNIIANEQSIASGSGIQVNANDDPVRNSIFENNIIFDHGQGFRVTGTGMSNNFFRNNVVRVLNGGLYCVDYIDNNKFHPAEVTFSGNRYMSNAQNWFHLIYTLPGGALGQTWYDIFEWPSASGEVDATTSLPNYLDPDRSVETYHATIGGSPSLDAFVAEARLQSFYNWRTEYTAAPIIAYIREGFSGTAPTISGGGWTEIGTAAAITVEHVEPTADFEWRKDGAVIPGADSFRLEFMPALEADGGAYTVRVTQSMGTTDLGPVPMLMVSELPAAGGGTLLALAAAVLGVGYWRLRRSRFARVRTAAKENRLRR